MKDSPGLHLKTYIFLLFIVLFAPLGNVLLGKGMKTIGSARDWEPQGLFHILLRILTSGYIWLGIACLLAFFVVAVLGLLLLGEKVNLLRWTGIAVICLGVFIVGHTHPRTTEKA